MAAESDVLFGDLLVAAPRPLGDGQADLEDRGGHELAQAVSSDAVETGIDSIFVPGLNDFGESAPEVIVDVAQMKAALKKAQAEVHRLTEVNAALSHQNKVLKRNISCIFRTAAEEITRVRGQLAESQASLRARDGGGRRALDSSSSGSRHSAASGSSSTTASRRSAESSASKRRRKG